MARGRPIRGARTWPAFLVLALTAALIVRSASLLVAGPGAAPSPARAPATRGPARHVVVLSLNGARADAVRAVVPPRLSARGAVSWTAQTTVPSFTLPTHASMLSGVGPEVHGVALPILDWSPGHLYFRRATIFTEVTRAGGRAAAIVHRQSLLMFAPPGSVTSAQYLPYHQHQQVNVVQAAVGYFVEQRPTLLFVQVGDPDEVGHLFGWMTPVYLKVIAVVPALIERLLRAFEDAGVSGQALLIVTGDHGGHDDTHGTTRPEDMTIPWMAFGRMVQPGVTIKRPIIIYDTAATVLAALGVPIPSDWRGRPVREALR